MISKIECILYAQIAAINVIEKNRTIDSYALYKEMCKLLCV